VLPSLPLNLLTLALPGFVVQIEDPSKTMPVGRFPTGNVPKFTPSNARTSLTVLSELLATHILVPSNATPDGPLPTVKLLRLKLLADWNLVTVLLPELVIQRFRPSHAMKLGPGPKLGKSGPARLALYQRSCATCSGLTLRPAALLPPGALVVRPGRGSPAPQLALMVLGLPLARLVLVVRLFLVVQLAQPRQL
jgi:hypothetical protein